jgi:hypothetical protein
LAVEQIQEITENFCNLVSLERNEKENDQATINLLRQEMSAMRTLIEKMQQKTTKNNHATDHADNSSIKAVIVGPTGMQPQKIIQAKLATPKDQGTKMMPLAKIQWEETSGENNNRDNQGRSVSSTILTL